MTSHDFFFGGGALVGSLVREEWLGMSWIFLFKGCKPQNNDNKNISNTDHIR